jgi:DNA polymerase III delta prime subunit
MMQGSWNAEGRPREIAEIVGQPEFIKDAKGWIENDSYPEALFFVGPPGTGKTSAARVIGMTMLGEGYDCDFYECNASDDRGIDFIRNVLKTIAQTSPHISERKVILLDEADGLTPAAQDAARQIVENNTKNCLFIFTANDGSKVRKAIQSRCVTYLFKPVDVLEGSEHLRNVCKKVMVPHSVLLRWSEFFPRLVRQMNGDLRACVNMLEALNPYEDALERKIGDLGMISKASMSSLTSDYMGMRLHFHKAVDIGRDRTFVMRSFYQNLSSLFEMDEEERIWDVLRVYGDMMTIIHTWPDNDYAFLDYFVAKLEGELKKYE